MFKNKVGGRIKHIRNSSQGQAGLLSLGSELLSGTGEK